MNAAMLGAYEFSMAMLGFCALMALVTAVFVLRRAFDRRAGEIGGWELRGAWGRIVAVGRHTVAEGLRTKLAVAFIVLILGFTLLFWLFARGDGTIKGRIQMFLNYTVGLSGFLMALLTIFFSCRSLSMEVSTRQIYGVVTKPIPRWQILAGKWSGVMFLNVVLVTITCLAAYVGTMTTLASFKRDLAHDLHTHGKLTPERASIAVAALDNVRGMGLTGYDSPIIPVLAEALGRTDEQVADMLLRLPEETRVNLRRFDELRRQVLVARATVTPEIPPEIDDKVQEIYEAMKADNRLLPGRTPQEMREQIRSGLERSLSTVSPGMENFRRWRLVGPKPAKGRDFLMSIRFKIQPSSYMNALPELQLEEETMACLWGLGDPGPSPPSFVEIRGFYPVNTFKEFEIPEDCVGEDGSIIVSFANMDPRNVDAVFDFPWGLQVLYRVGSFRLSVFQVGLALLIPLACLASFGVCASTFLSFPVASLIVITLYIMSVSIGFVAESLGTTKDFYDPQNIPKEVRFRQVVVGGMKWVLAIGDCEPATNLIEGRATTWQTLWDNTWRYVLIKSALIMMLGVLVFRRRELAAVVV